MSEAMESSSHEAVLEAMAEVMERQARVNRAEAALAAARRRLSQSISRLSRLRAASDAVDLPPHVSVDLAPEGLPSEPTAGDDERPGTLRERILAVMEASPGEVYTPARLAPAVGSRNRDSIRNTLLVLAAKGRIEKVGAGRYQARVPAAP